jgi:HK97 family phage prohead protease
MENNVGIVTIADGQLKAAPVVPGQPDAGWIEGYVAVYGNIDAGGEIMARGCFTRSIHRNVPTGKVKLMVRHFSKGGDVMDVIGTVTQAKEDPFGLWIHAKLSSVDLAQEVRTKILEGHIKGLSVGYVVRQESYTEIGGKKYKLITE